MGHIAEFMTRRRSPAAAPVAPGEPPVVVVGAGPVGVRFAQELARRAPEREIVVYGDEPWEPYNRVQLSSLLSGEVKWAALAASAALPESPRVRTVLACEVVAIDREAATLTDIRGDVQPWSRLVLATGSRPHVPEIPGVGLAGVHTFRDMADAQRLMARRVRSRRTVVLGGGLLGLEAARAMRRYNTEVVVVEQGGRLMPRQTDAGAAARVLAHVEGLGIRVILGDGVRRIDGDTMVAAVELRSGERIACDTVVVATGIKPSVGLALKAQLTVGRGIRVNDAMQTSDPRIYAIGECAEHRGTVYGIVAPGFEQAAVAAHHLCGGAAGYQGSIAATRLKVLDLPVFSVGVSGEDDAPGEYTRRVHADPHGYRCLVTRAGRLVGALAVGPWDDLSRVQEAVIHGRRLMPWQAWRFRASGRVWPAADTATVAEWPAAATVCTCTGVTRGRLSQALAGGCATVGALASATGASTVCGSCKPLLAELLGSAAARQPARAAKPLWVSAMAALVLGALLLLLPGLPYPDSVQVAWRWDILWRDPLWKQVSGYTLGGLALLGLTVSARKRIGRFTLGDFALWRYAHALLGTVGLLVLYLHTGGRFGGQVDFLLGLSFALLAVAGAGAGLVAAAEHRLPAARAQRLRANWNLAHLLLAWPVPVLLAFHILKFYWY